MREWPAFRITNNWSSALMRLLALLIVMAIPIVAQAQTMPTPVPAEEVFTREQIGRALADPTPSAGKTAPSAANAPQDDGQWTMPSKNYAATRFSSLTEITPENARSL